LTIAGPSASERLKHHFLNHQWFWASLLIGLWLVTNVGVLTTTVLMEAHSRGHNLPFWEPFCWEVTSIVMIVLLIILIRIVTSRHIEPRPWLQQVFIHLLLTLPFSIIHITGMMALRKLWYWLAGADYHPFSEGWFFVFVYEYRKDFLSYFIILFVLYGYRMMVLRLRGEASYVPTGEQTPAADDHPDTLLVKKLGKEFLIKTETIDWVEAAGNYANLHVGAATYPMRITMARLEKLLPDKTFVRIHRSSIVNLNQVDHIEPQDAGDHLLTLKNGRQLNFSRRYREAFKEVLQSAN